MLSLDIASLFTNIPLTETIDKMCVQLLEIKIEIQIPISKMKELLLKCIVSIYFMFNNEFYRQIDVVAMRSPPHPILTYIFLVKLENGTLKDLLNKLHHYCGCIDDTLIECDENIDKQELLNSFVKVPPAIKFISEEGKGHSIAFLDGLLFRGIDGSVKRNAFRKITWTLQCIHFHSFTPIQYKIDLSHPQSQTIMF
ncbi:unnamed protein product [Schistosoma bovis]|nr:unnamed protein product [Schistosoma bovis]